MFQGSLFFSAKMRWTPRQLMLPVLIGMSLTGVSLGILYFLIEMVNFEINEKFSNVNLMYIYWIIY